MANYSTGTRNALLGDGCTVSSLFDGSVTFTASTSTLAATSIGASLAVGDVVYVYGSASNDGRFTIATTATNAVTVNETVVDEGAVSCYVVEVRGADMRDIFDGGYADIYSGDIPSDADTTESGTLLVSYGPIRFSDPSSASMSLATTVSATAAATGTGGYCRLYDENHTTGASTTACRVDLTVGVGYGEAQLESLSITSGNSHSLSDIAIGAQASD